MNFDAECRKLKASLEVIGHASVNYGEIDGLLLVGARDCETADQHRFATGALLITDDALKDKAAAVEMLLHAAALEAMAARYKHLAGQLLRRT